MHSYIRVHRPSKQSISKKYKFSENEYNPNYQVCYATVEKARHFSPNFAGLVHTNLLYKFIKAIFSVFYNISKQNLEILLVKDSLSNCAGRFRFAFRDNKIQSLKRIVHFYCNHNNFNLDGKSGSTSF